MTDMTTSETSTGAYVLDATAVLSFLAGKRGSEKVTEAARTGATLYISALSYSELLGQMYDHGLVGKTANLLLAPLQLRIVPFDEAWAVATAEARNWGETYISVSARASMAMAVAYKIPLMTSDRFMFGVDPLLGLEILMVDDEVVEHHEWACQRVREDRERLAAEEEREGDDEGPSEDGEREGDIDFAVELDRALGASGIEALQGTGP